MADDVVPGSSHFKFKMDQIGTNFLALPPEIVRAVLILPSVSLKDVLSVAQTCQKMNVLVSDDCNDVWRAKHRQRFVQLVKGHISFVCLNLIRSYLLRTGLIIVPISSIYKYAKRMLLSFRDYSLDLILSLFFLFLSLITIMISRWPDANKALLDISVELDWQSECKRAFHVIDMTVKLMEEVWPKVYMESEVCYSHFAPLRQIMEEDRTAYYYIKDFLLKTERDGNM